MAGPIAFASDGPADDKGPTEFGGVAGLVQASSVRGAVGRAHGAENGAPGAVLSADDERGIIVRAQGAVRVDAVTGLEVADPSGDAVDPVTGLAVGAWNEDGSAATGVVDRPPKTLPPG